VGRGRIRDRGAAHAYPLAVHIAGIFAHPDDLELWAGGTALLHAAAGDRLTLMLFYELHEHRIAELRAAWDGMPIDIRHAPTEPYAPVDNAATHDLLDDVPAVVLTHWQHDTHIEHKLAFQHAVRFCHAAKRYSKRTPLLLMTSTYAAHGDACVFDPEILIDITGTIDRKRRAIQCHSSQHSDHLLADVESQNRIFGARIGVDYAEGFIEYPLFGCRRRRRVRASRILSKERRKLADRHRLHVGIRKQVLVPGRADETRTGRLRELAVDALVTHIDCRGGCDGVATEKR